MEDIITKWVSSHIPMVATWIIGIGGVSIFFKKYGPKIRRFIKIGSKGLIMIDTLLNIVEDDKITEEEAAQGIACVKAFKESLK